METTVPSDPFGPEIDGGLRSVVGPARPRAVRYSDGPDSFAKAAEDGRGGKLVILRASAAETSGAYRTVRDAIARPRSNVKILAEAGADDVDDLGVLRGVPGLTLCVPADRPTVRSAVASLAGFDGPAYLRLPSPNAAPVTDATFQVGRATTLRDGHDLTVVGIGPMVARALEVAAELSHVGVSTRVLDFASFKPHDEKTLLRAARETGAILTLEEHSVLTGLGALVASAVAEEAPVPVRRVGIPDLFPVPDDPGAVRDPRGRSLERCLEEAWTLLRAKGKVQ